MELPFLLPKSTTAVDSRMVFCLEREFHSKKYDGIHVDDEIILNDAAPLLISHRPEADW